MGEGVGEGMRAEVREDLWELPGFPVLQLPEFPELGALDFAWPPIPRLVPQWERLQRLQAYGVREPSVPAGLAHSSAPVVALGVGAGALCAIAVAISARSARRARIRLRTSRAKAQAGRGILAS